MKTIGLLIILVFGSLLVTNIYICIEGDYQYEKDFKSYWNLADKASTIPQKAEYIDKFVAALESSNMKGEYNAVFLKTPDNGFDYNFNALKSLQLRLHEIEKMDITSFQYQTAIQQITQQEQGEASAMLNVFEGIWWKSNHIILWNWIGIIEVFLIIILFLIGCFFLFEDF